MRRSWAAGAALAALLGSGAAALAQNQCGGLIAAACLQSLGAGSTPLPDSDCGKQLAEYRTCLAGVASAAGGPVSRGAQCSEARAARLWASAEASNSCIAYESFIAACPDTPEARFAQGKKRELGCSVADAAPARPVQEPTPAPAPGSAAPSAPAAPVWPDREAYRAAQRELRRLGLYESGVDGDWGPGSRRAMTEFQQRAGIAPVDGLLTQAAFAALKTAPTPPFEMRPVRELTGLKDYVAGLGVTPDGAYIVALDGVQNAFVWRLSTGELVNQFKVDQSCSGNGVSFAKNSQNILLTCSSDIIVWNILTGSATKRYSLNGNHYNYEIALSPDERFLAAGGSDGVAIFDTGTGALLRSFKNHTEHVYSVMFSDDSSEIYSGDWGGFIKVFNVATGAQLREISGHSDQVAKILAAQDGGIFLTLDRSKAVLRRKRDARPLRTIDTNWYGAEVALSNDGRYYADGDYKGNIDVWDLRRGDQVASVKAITGQVTGLAFAPDNKHLIIGGQKDGRYIVSVWRIGQ